MRLIHTLSAGLLAGVLLAPAGGAAAAAPVAPVTAEQAEETGVLRFDVKRAGSKIGTHQLTFRRKGERLTVTVDIDLAVGIGPITFFRYSHDNTTTWEGGRLVAMTTRTDDDGTAYRVDAKRLDDGRLQVRTQEDTKVVDGTVLPSTYWIAATTEADKLLNTQKGTVDDITVEADGVDTVETADGAVQAQRYVIHGALDTHIWYRDMGRWVGLAFDARGERITYHLTEHSGYLPTEPPQPNQS
ncbi:DUF6134 family protein [Rhodovibrio salinarum]|uniref:DUF3108 domain-containing protein n=1 Tax=Rhodovibrio salinarum TaxID=1087 RepID=A0A934QH35_9PROT|nr:DUF6134 family protein [Rhodovibrio salinarum]MBK1696684.1 hypothetical protein [Rhodovibrio salinarum]